MRTAQGCLSEGDFLLGEDDDGFACSLLPTEGACRSLPRADSRYQWEAAAHLPDNIKSRAQQPLGMLPGLPGMGRGPPEPPGGLETR